MDLETRIEAFPLPPSNSWSAKYEPVAEGDDGGDQPVVRPHTRTTERVMSYLDGSRVERVSGTTEGSCRSRELVKSYAWRQMTSTTRESKWILWLDFCDEERRVVLQVTEGHLVALIGWAVAEREAGRRQVSSSSIPQYIRAVQQMQLLTIGTPVQKFAFVSLVRRAYEKWEEETYPKATFRSGIAASEVRNVWLLGMESATSSTVSDFAMVVFSYCVNGLRQSSVWSI